MWSCCVYILCVSNTWEVGGGGGSVLCCKSPLLPCRITCGHNDHFHLDCYCSFLFVMETMLIVVRIPIIVIAVVTSFFCLDFGSTAA